MGPHAARQLPDGDPTSVLRRAPFSDNPRVGARGQRAHQRILEAALQVFGEEGYHQCGVIRITEVAGCSRAAFYQYFSSKEDVFRHLAGQVARQLVASAEALGPVTADLAGWQTLRTWVARHGQIYDRYEPVFEAHQAAAESDKAVASGSARIADRTVAGVRAKLTTSVLPSRQLDEAIAILLECMTRVRRIAEVVGAALAQGPAGASAYPRSRVDDAITDIVHRTLVGRLDPDVNVHAPTKRRPPRIPMGPVMLQGLQADDGPHDLSPTGARTLAALLAAGHDVLVARGYHGTRVDDITQAARVSHGAFYRYFDNKDHLIRLLAARAIRTVSVAMADIPDISDIVDSPDTARSATLPRWLRRYHTTQASEAAMIRVWLDATADDPSLQAESAAALDWGRRRMARFLEPRGFGDVDAEALVMVALLDAFGARPRGPSTVPATAHIIERGFLGR
ncbi:MAG: TetR/AcrR family transcriptional regulator [Acidimicrobiales bacterium]